MLTERLALTVELLERIRTGVVSVGVGGRVSFANRTALVTLGRSAEACIGVDVADVFGGSAELRALVEVLPEGAERRLEVCVRRPDRSSVDIGVTALKCAPATPQTNVILLFRDLHEARNAEAELRRVERLGALGSTVAGFAHGIRNPIAAIQGLTEAMRQDLPEGDPRHEHVSRILGQVQRIERLIAACLQFGDPRPPRMAEANVSGLVQAAVDALRSRFHEGSPRLELPRRPVFVRADAGQIAEGLIHLVENALESTGDPGRVLIRVLPETSAGRVRIDVVDDGPGIADGLLSRIFDPFFTTKPQGTGLGLTLVQALVSENQGNVSVESHPNVETTFRIELAEAGA